MDHVAAAGLKGVLNDKPTLGFLVSLARMATTLEKAFERAQAAGGAEGSK